MTFDLYRQWILHQVQADGLRRGLPRRLLLRGRKHARHPSRGMYRLWGMRAGMSGWSNPAWHRRRSRKWLKLNADYAKIWPNITIKRDPPADSKEWEGKPDKLQYFSPNPGKGD